MKKLVFITALLAALAGSGFAGGPGAVCSREHCVKTLGPLVGGAAPAAKLCAGLEAAKMACDLERVCASHALKHGSKPGFAKYCDSVAKGGCNCAGAPESFARAGCKKAVVVTGMHYPALNCAQSKADFMGGMMTSSHFISRCAPDILLSVQDISCQDHPVNGFSSGAVYKGTACCGEPPAPRCVKTAVVGGLHDPDATTCAVRMDNFKSRVADQVKAWDKPGPFSSACLPGLRLLSVDDLTCEPARGPEYAGGSLYGGTACCGKTGQAAD
ncbi:MAG TPA: hypothetical protein DCZ92_08185 [Elusimicrobia bacterium]|nr:MAG: hypothetical protein A2016_12175 [Elusimicrobia bacterium GWF2_62_30]HBA60783.1 hypothetical protein [Elusimicrobiota bacterium]